MKIKIFLKFFQAKRLLILHNKAYILINHQNNRIFFSLKVNLKIKVFNLLKINSQFIKTVLLKNTLK